MNLTKRRTALTSSFLSSALVAICLVSCVPQRLTTGTFTQLNGLETELRRGVSTKADVERVLGPAKGSGGALFPLSPATHEVWFYQDIEVTGLKTEGAARRVIRFETRQQILLVFFNEGLFDGFMWYSNAVPGMGLAK